jgi:trans-2,3-dihydro-3-hydroxyanthranilate isomerase
MRLAFILTDVFTTGPLTGNPLAVCWSLGHWSVGGMQAIAREFAFSETAFIESLPSPGKAVRLRIFTPRKEIPFAGHPVLGSAAAIWKQLGQQRSNQLALILPQAEISIQQERDLAWFEAPAMRWPKSCRMPPLPLNWG